MRLHGPLQGQLKQRGREGAEITAEGGTKMKSYEKSDILLRGKKRKVTRLPSSSF
jgi:hypothetical protein